jgi:pimeloyl-ACP methyl ester carboxylesterase
MPTTTVHGTELYYEKGGSGPSVLFIAGATGDGGHFQRVAERLADEFTVVTYDRRANSRSPRTEGWNATSTREQSEDAAALVTDLRLTPVAMFATSGGAVIGLDLLLSQPEAVRLAIFHEPALFSGLPDPEEPNRIMQPIIEPAMAAGGPRAAVEAFVRTVAGDAGFEGLDPALRERMLGNGEVLFGTEFGVFESYRPDDAALQAVRCPVHVMAGTESPPFLIETSRWLAQRFGVPVETLPGGHAPYFDRPDEMAETIRPLLKEAAA